MKTETVTDVLAEMRDYFDDEREMFDTFSIRIQAAHAREVGELKKGIERRPYDIVVPLALWDEVNHDALEWKDRAEEDAARIDYMERTFRGMTNGERYLTVTMGWGKSHMGRTLREACDKYMAREVSNTSSITKEPK